MSEEVALSDKPTEELSPDSAVPLSFTALLVSFGSLF